jgi:GT2 family glycosyltransferase
VRYFLEQCVRSVQKALENLDAEIIVVDNNSSDDSCLMMKQLFPQITLIENKENLGFPKGNNIAVEQAKGEYICILNPDTVVAEDTFKKLLAKSCQPSAGIIGCKLIDGTGNFLPESKRGLPTPYVAITKIFGLYKISNFFGKYYAQHLSENQSGKVDVLVGAFMMMKRDLYIKVGGFDENCFMYSDDIDLSYRSLQAGKKNYYNGKVTCIHYKGESTLRDHKYMRRFQEAMQFFYRKHFGQSVFSWFLMIGLRVGAFLFSLQKKKQAVTQVKPIRSYVLVSNQEALRVTLEMKLQAPVIRTEDFHIQPGLANREVLFDADFISNKSCIVQMKQLAKSGLTFKIKPKNASFILGSNHSNDRGSVISWGDLS